MDPPITDHRARDGSRQFASFAPARSWRRLVEDVKSLPGVTEAHVLADGLDEVWFDFRYSGQLFTLHESLGELRCFVRDPAAPPALLAEVAALCGRHSAGPES